MSKRKVCGIGVNDAGYPIDKRYKCKVTGKNKVLWACPYYSKWSKMLYRCYDKKCLEKHPQYLRTSVCKEWLLFSNFRKWMLRQKWYVGGEALQLDKDILGGGTLYSPDTCCFVTERVNNFVKDLLNKQYGMLCGSTKVQMKTCIRYRSRVNNGYGNNIHLGYYDTTLEAHHKWYEHKVNLLLEMKESLDQLDTRLYRKILENIRERTYVSI